jgi:hypothetical protein
MVFKIILSEYLTGQVKILPPEEFETLQEAEAWVSKYYGQLSKDCQIVEAHKYTSDTISRTSCYRRCSRNN